MPDGKLCENIQYNKWDSNSLPTVVRSVLLTTRSHTHLVHIDVVVGEVIAESIYHLGKVNAVHFDWIWCVENKLVADILCGTARNQYRVELS